MDHEDYLPSFCVITDGKRSDVKVAHTLSFDPGTVVVDDRGYNDYRLFAKWTECGVFFVTRMKDNALYEEKGKKGSGQRKKRKKKRVRST